MAGSGQEQSLANGGFGEGRFPTRRCLIGPAAIKLAYSAIPAIEASAVFSTVREASTPVIFQPTITDMTDRALSNPNMPFDRMNESDVRGEVLDPLLHRLGYAMTGSAFIRREHPLKYPYLYLGRKKPGKDLELRGNADYTLEVAGHARWTLEAKSPNQALDEDVLQQAWSYAIHPEVQSSYFAISNGRSFMLYSTSAAWGAPPLISCSYSDLDTRFEEVEAFLGPAQLARRHPNHLLSAGRPLGPNLRAFERVATGTISYTKSSLAIPMLNEMQISIIDGDIRRDSFGRIEANLLTRGPFRGIQERVDELGLQWQKYVTDDERLAVSPDAPTVLQYEADMILPIAMDLTTFRPTALAVPIRVKISAKAIGHLFNDVFSGEFLAEMAFHFGEDVLPVSNEGTFEIRLS